MITCKSKFSFSAVQSPKSTLKNIEGVMQKNFTLVCDWIYYHHTQGKKYTRQVQCSNRCLYQAESSTKFPGSCFRHMAPFCCHKPIVSGQYAYTHIIEQMEIYNWKSFFIFMISNWKYLKQQQQAIIHAHSDSVPDNWVESITIYFTETFNVVLITVTRPTKMCRLKENAASSHGKSKCNCNCHNACVDFLFCNIPVIFLTKM